LLSCLFLNVVHYLRGANIVARLGVALGNNSTGYLGGCSASDSFYICPNNEASTLRTGYSIRDAMDPWTHNHVKLKTGHTYHYVDQKPDLARANGDTIICLHGFPDQWFGWRNQIKPWARAGYRVIVPSMLGYGGSVR